MIRIVMLLSAIVTAWFYTHQQFGAFSVHQAALRSPELLALGKDQALQPILQNVRHSVHGAEPSVWSNWVATLGAGVAQQTGQNVKQNQYKRPAATPLRLANMTGEALTVLIQSELYRLGCFQAKIDGQWGSATQKAILRFAGHNPQNVRPVRAGRTPDLETLTALRQASPLSCADKCKTGFAADAAGNCHLQTAAASVEEELPANLTPDHPAFLPKRNPSRVQEGSGSLEHTTSTEQRAFNQIDLPQRNLRKRRTAMATPL